MYKIVEALFIVSSFSKTFMSILWFCLKFIVHLKQKCTSGIITKLNFQFLKNEKPLK